MPFLMSRKIRLAQAGVEILQTTISSSPTQQMASPGIKPRSQRPDFGCRQFLDCGIERRACIGQAPLSDHLIDLVDQLLAGRSASRLIELRLPAAAFGLQQFLRIVDGIGRAAQQFVEFGDRIPGIFR